MVSSNTDNNNNPNMFALDQQLENSALGDYLRSCGYSFRIFANQDELITLLSLLDTLAVIAQANQKATDIYETITSKTAIKPLFILVAQNDQIDNNLQKLADAILPSVSDKFSKHIETLLKYHQENMVLRWELMQVEKEVERQKHINSEIEVLKNAIVRNVSHELRTPLLHLKSAVSMIKEIVGSEDNLIFYAENATARMEILVKNITMLGQSLDINIGPIILRDSIDYAKRTLGRVWLHRDEVNRINVSIENNLPAVMADKQGLSIVLQLLIDNAMKFSDTKPIEIIARRQEDKVYIAVIDHGIGIAEDKLQAIFDTFYQVDSSSTRRYGGTGIGLTIAQLVLERHKTDIHVESTVGKGSTFWFLLDCVEMNQ